MTEELRQMIPLALAVLFLGSLCITLANLIAVSVTIARRLKKEFNKDERYLPMSPWIFWASSIAICCVLRERSKHKRMYPFFRGYDVYSFATCFEKIFCYLTVFGFFFSIALVGLAYACDMFLGTEIIGT